MAVTTIPTAGITDDAVSTAKIADDAVTTAKTSYSAFPFRNLIINGDMSIAQRGTSTTGVTNASGYYACDRWLFAEEGFQTPAFTISQTTDVPSGQGFVNSFKIDCTTADTSLSADNLGAIQQRIEGQNLQHLKFGTSSAESTTLSFWVKSTKTGTYQVNMRNQDNASMFSQTYTISSSDTWQKVTMTFTGDTGNAFSNDNGESIRLEWLLYVGTNYTSGTFASTWSDNLNNSARGVNHGVNFADSTSNEWYITGVQLEVCTTASDFEFLPHDVNMQRCMRYLQHTPFITGANSMTAPTNEGIEIMGARHKFADVHGFRSQTITHYVPMRTQPTITFYNPANSGTTGQFRLYDKDGNTQNFSGFTQLWDRYGFNMGGYTGVSVGTAGDTVWILGMHWKADAEL